MDEKLWLNWIKNGNIGLHNSSPSKKMKREDILCYYIIQDCNMGGEYYRVYMWFNNYKAEPYFEINIKDFNEKYSELNDVVTSKYGNKYQISTDGQFKKLLTLI